MPKISELPELTSASLVSTDIFPIVDVSASTTKKISYYDFMLIYPSQGRLTLESGSPISISDQSDKTTLYYTPYMGDFISVYDGTDWIIKRFTEISLNISGYTASKPYDIFLYDNSGVLTLEGGEWTSASARATGLSFQNGIYVKSGSATRRYLGTIYMDSSSYCQDTEKRRYVWNFYNQTQRRVHINLGGHTYDSTDWRYWDNSIENSIRIITGLYTPLTMSYLVYIASGNGYFDINPDGSTESDYFIMYINGAYVSEIATFTFSNFGYHSYNILEKRNVTLVNIASAHVNGIAKM